MIRRTVSLGIPTYKTMTQVYPSDVFMGNINNEIIGSNHWGNGVVF